MSKMHRHSVCLKQLNFNPLLAFKIILLYDFRRISCHNAIFRNRLCYHAVGSDNCAFSNFHARKNRNKLTNPDIIVYNHGLCRKRTGFRRNVGSGLRAFRITSMTDVAYENLACDKDIITDFNFELCLAKKLLIISLIGCFNFEPPDKIYLT